MKISSQSASNKCLVDTSYLICRADLEWGRGHPTFRMPPVGKPLVLIKYIHFYQPTDFCKDTFQAYFILISKPYCFLRSKSKKASFVKTFIKGPKRHFWRFFIKKFAEKIILCLGCSKNLFGRLKKSIW